MSAALIVLVVLVSILASAQVDLPAAAAEPLPIGTITPMATGAATFESIVAGADGNVWFSTNTTIGKVTPDGAFTVLSDPAIVKPTSVTATPDGNIWFLSEQQHVSRLTPAGIVTTFTSDLMDTPTSLAAGPDGSLWFSNTAPASIGRITPTGTVSSFTAPDLVIPANITAGPDGNMWFTDPGNYANTSLVGMIAPDGAIQTRTIGYNDFAEDITAGADGNLWITASHLDEALQVTTPIIARVGLGPTPLYTAFADPALRSATHITNGPDGNVWFTGSTSFDSLDDGIGRVTPAGTITMFSDPDLLSVQAVAAGPDGNVWFGNWGGYSTTNGSIGHITPAGVVARFGERTVQDPRGIVRGPDGNVWWTNSRQGGSISRITPAGVVTTVVDPGIADPYGITNGPGGDLWFTNRGDGGSIGRITTAGSVTTLTDPAMVRPESIALGADGNLWFTDLGEFGNPTRGFIGRLTPAGVLTTFTHPIIRNPSRILAAPDGNLWFSSRGDGTIPVIGRITPAGAVSTVIAASPNEMTVGPDGNVWVTDDFNDVVDGHTFAEGTITRVTPAGAATTFTGPNIKVPDGITAGEDGSLWYPQRDDHNGRSSIGRITPDGVATMFPAPNGWNERITRGADGNLWYTDRFAQRINRISTGSTPGAPAAVTGVAGAAGSGVVEVSWTAPATNGHPITGYTVTAVPGGATCIWGGGPLSCTVGGLTAGGTYTFTVTATNSLGTGAASPPSAPVTLQRFVDVGDDAPFAADIEWLAAESITTGYTDGTFRPAAPVSRQAMAAFLYRRAGNPDGPSPTCGTAPFTDVPVGAPFCGEIAWLVDHGVAGGYGDGSFRPWALVSRQAMAAFLYRTVGAPAGAHPACAADAFPDVPVGSTFCGEIAWLVDHDLVDGYPDGTFRPLAGVTRQAAAALLHRLSTVAPG